MAFYYVKKGGTATGDAGRYATQQTGSFASLGASGYYDEVALACGAATPPDDGDFILASHLHSHVDTIGFSWSTAANPTDYVAVWSVDDTDITQYLAGASEDTGPAGDFNCVDSWHARGFNLITIDDIDFGGNRTCIFEDCVIRMKGAASQIGLIVDGVDVKLINTEVQLDNSAGKLAAIGNGNTLTMIGGKITDLSGSGTASLMTIENNGGGTALFYGADLSDVTGTIIQSSGGGGFDDQMDAQLHGCKLNPLVDDGNEDLLRPYMRVQRFNCFSSTDGETVLTQKQYTGTSVNQTTIYRDESGAYPSGDKAAQEITTKANCGSINPFIVDYLARYFDLSTTTSVRFHIATTATLNDFNTWAEMVYQDATPGVSKTFITTKSTDIDGGTELSDDSGNSTWMNGAVDLTGYNEYFIDIDTSSNPGGSGIPYLYLKIGVPSETVYVDITPTAA